MDFRGSVDTSVRIGVLKAQDATFWAWSGSSLTVQLPAECINTLEATPLGLGIEMGVVRLLAPHP